MSSTQNPNAGIAITILPGDALQHCRLLELPAELLALVTSAAPSTLQLKSRENIDGTVKDANTVLCTSERTYNIRQVSTSNTVFLTKSAKRSNGDGGSCGIGMDAVAKSDSTLELIAADAQSAMPFIKAALPTYTSNGTHSSEKAISKAELFSHIPMSDAECEEGWKGLACFESTSPPGSFVPSANVKIEIWQKALTAAVAEGVAITDAFVADKLPAFAIDLQEDWPTELLSAVFTAMSKSTPGGNLAIDQDRCVQFVGLSLLEARSRGRSTNTAKFLETWKDSVPEAWRGKCEVSVLLGYYAQDDSSIKLIELGTAGSINATSTGTEAGSTLGAKRKWHDKFRSSKKV